jgi:signal transduction histidine kinase
MLAVPKIGPSWRAGRRSAKRCGTWTPGSRRSSAYEAARPYFEYLAYYPQARTYTRILNPIEEGEVLTPSPLLEFESPFFVLHFQLDVSAAQGKAVQKRERPQLSSPQVPTGNFRDLAEGVLQNATMIRAKEQRLQHLTRLLEDTPHELSELYQVARREASLPVARAEPSPAQQLEPSQLSNNYAQRALSTNLAKQSAWGNRMLRGSVLPGSEPVQLHPMLPIWLEAKPDLDRDSGPDTDSDEDPKDATLLFVREVEVHGRRLLQGILADWPALQRALLATLSPGPELRYRLLPGIGAPSAASASFDRHQDKLATVPARLDLEIAPSFVPLESSGTALVLLLAWGGLLLSLTTVGFAVRSAVRQGERRARFASAVTHELRTPLTTFRMYAEMLADDLIQDPEQRREYLRTLERESQRLSRLVENVLGYARIEDGRFSARPRRLALSELLSECSPLLERRAEDAGLGLETRLEADAELFVDDEAVQQILFNLVDNACKYGQSEQRPCIELRAELQATSVRIEVRDHGPGITSEARRSIFEPFERRGARAGSENQPGVGLGLALSRALARDLGGELRLRPIAQGEGACFVLELPRASADSGQRSS